MNALSVFLISLLSIIPVVNSDTDGFIQIVNEAYSNYAVVANVDHNAYKLVVISGKVNGDEAYGIYFYSEVKDAYSVYIKCNDEVLLPDADSRGTVFNVAIKRSIDDVVSYYILNSSNQQVDSGNIALINVISEQHLGESRGTEYSQLTSMNQMYRNQIILYSSLGTVIMICIVVLVIYASTHSGMFAKSKRTAGVFNMKEFLQNAIDEEDPYDPLQNVTLKTSSEIIEGEVIEETKKEPFNIKRYLSDKGFVINYSSLSEEEKNMIMLELMILKRENKITEEEYKKESVELWRK